MDKGVINQGLLEKNIEKIQFYVEMEQQVLTKLCRELEEASNSYHSENMSLFLNNISNIRGNIDSIIEKRNEYVDVLNQVIMKYNDLGLSNQQFFKRGA